ncbi:MAG: Cyclic nucleotide-binding domain, partial [Deltaproteobacteria bacterium]|nr:Cyclic nucleotide-binding domain [Deltaproteobacteria bacterium]
MEIAMKRPTPDFTKYADFFDKKNIKEYKAGEYVFHKGDKGDCMFVVLDGQLEIVAEDMVLSTIEQ